MWLSCHLYCQAINLFPEKLPEDTQIDSDNGLTCDQQGRMCHAQGHIRVKRGNLVLTCHKVEVYFNKCPQTGQQEISQILAFDNIRIEDKVDRYYVTAQKLVYNHSQNTVTLSHQPYLNHPKLIIKNATAITFDSLNFQTRVTGRATAVNQDRIIIANNMTALFDHGSKQNDLSFKHLRALGDVIISTPREIARAQVGLFDNVTQQVELRDHVIITNNDGQVQGQKALMDLNTGVSRMIDSANHENRIKILMIPQKKMLRAPQNVKS